MTILFKDDPIIRKAHKSYQKFTQDDKLRELYEAREKWRHDQASRMEDAMEKGLKKGREKTAKETALKMRVKGYPLDEIAELTGLSKDEIEKLK